jgi:hypothetical protein
MEFSNIFNLKKWLLLDFAPLHPIKPPEASGLKILLTKKRSSKLGVFPYNSIYSWPWLIDFVFPDRAP